MKCRPNTQHNAAVPHLKVQVQHAARCSTLLHNAARTSKAATTATTAATQHQRSDPSDDPATDPATDPANDPANDATSRPSRTIPCAQHSGSVQTVAGRHGKHGMAYCAWACRAGTPAAIRPTCRSTCASCDRIESHRSASQRAPCWRIDAGKLGKQWVPVHTAAWAAGRHLLRPAHATIDCDQHPSACSRRQQPASAAEAGETSRFHRRGTAISSRCQRASKHVRPRGTHTARPVL